MLSFVVGVLGLVLLMLKNPLASGLLVSSAILFVGMVVSDGVFRLEKAIAGAKPPAALADDAVESGAAVAKKS